jgi:prephenate dehydrogenase
MDERGEGRLFRKAALLGVGLIGGSVGMAIKEKGLAARVVGSTTRLETLSRAKEVGAIDDGSLDICEVVQGADLVILAAPVHRILEDLAALPALVSPGAIVTDVGSTKTVIVRASAKVSRAGAYFVGGHPMAGSEKAGVAAARPDLFHGAVWALCPGAAVPRQVMEKMEKLVAAVGARSVLLKPEEHDLLVAAISHLPHLVSAALVEQAEKAARRHPKVRMMAATGFRDTTRLAGGEPALWRDIFMSNRRQVLAAIDRLIRELSDFRAALDGKDETAVESFLERARQARPKYLAGAG